MALLHPSSSSSLTAKKFHYLLSKPPCPRRTHLTIRLSQDPSSVQSPTPAEETSSSTQASPSKKPASAGLGFGSSGPTKPNPSPDPSKKKQKGKRERASVIRRAPIETPKFVSQKDEAQAQEQSRNESAFLLAWLGLGGIILVQGIALAASGFLPEQWDGFFVKYLYPSFTPTVFLFVAGTVGYGVLKYLQNEQFRSEK